MMGRKRGRAGRMAKREERDQGYPARADRVVRRAVRRLVKVERRLERAQRELDESAADIETLQGQIRALRVAMMAPGVEAAPGAPPVAETPQPVAEAVVETPVAAEVAEAVVETPQPVAEVVETPVAAEEPAKEIAIVEADAAPSGEVQPGIAAAEIEAEIEAAAVIEAETAETPRAMQPADEALGSFAALAGEVLEPDEVPPAGEAVWAATDVQATPARPIASAVPEAPPGGDVWPAAAPTGVADDSRWPLPEERPAAPPDAAAVPGAPSAADASAASETDADAAISDLADQADQADQASPQRRIFRGWPFIDPERRW